MQKSRKRLASVTPVAFTQLTAKQQKRLDRRNGLHMDIQQAMPTPINNVVPLKKTFHERDLKSIKPLTDNQTRAFDEWFAGQHLVLDGYAGTGKSFCALYLALRAVLDPESEQSKIIIGRST